MKKTLSPLAYVSTLMLASITLSGQAATIPYTNDFDSTGFENQNSALTLDTGAGTLTLTSPAGNPININASDPFTNVADSSFSMRTSFQVTNISSGTFTIGFGAFGGDANFANGLMADWSVSDSGMGKLRLYNFSTASELASATVDANPSSSTMAVELNTTYFLRLDVTNIGTDLYDLSLAVFAANGTTQIGNTVSYSGYSAASAPVGGYEMGFRNRAGGTGKEVVFDSFSAIPEPSTYAFTLAALLGMTCLNRRMAVRRTTDKLTH